MRTAIFLTLLVAVGCTQSKSEKMVSKPSQPSQPSVAAAAIESLRAGDFKAALRDSDEALKTTPTNSYAAAVRAIGRYQRAGHALLGVFSDMRDFDHKAMRSGLRAAASQLAMVESDLAIAAQDSSFGLELCLACWERDWNHDGEVDDRDRLLFQIEEDFDGNEYPEDDARRKPTFRFDNGDIYWARAMVAFQSALIEILLAYDWTGIEAQLKVGDGIHLKLGRPLGIAKARAHILAGLKHSRSSRTAYLTETDDDREWVPNPTQDSHPMPLPMDAELYDTWEGVLDDLEDLLAQRTGISAEQVAQLGDHVWDNPPTGFVDVGRMLAEPKDIIISFNALSLADKEKDVDALLQTIFADYYVKSMKASPLPTRLLRMKRELETGSDSFDRKLRYLLWIN